MGHLQILERSVLEQLREHLATVTGLMFVVTDDRGRVLTQKGGFFSDFCLFINRTYEGEMACETFRLELVRAAVTAGRMEQRVCHAGLINVAVPLTISGAIEVVILGGGVARVPPEAKTVTNLAEELGCDRAGLLEAAGRMPVWTEERLTGAVALLQAMGDLMVQSLHRLRTFTRILEVQEILSSTLDEETILTRTVEGAAQVLGVSFGLLRLYEESTGTLVARAVYGADRELLEKIRNLPATGSAAGQVFKTGQPLVVNDIHRFRDIMLLPVYAPEIRAALIVPVQLSGKTLGTLAVYSSTSRQWDEADTGYLATIAVKMALALENARLYKSLRDYYLGAMQALAAALEAKDTYTRGHSVRVARWARACAGRMGLGAEEQERTYVAGLLHDLGKIGIPEDILFKPGRLTGEEWREIQRHPVLGAEILEPAKFPAAVIAAVRHHHEDYGGGGYPAGLVGENIPLPARIIRVADAYDAMTSARAYRGALTPEQAQNELRRGTGRQFDPRVVDVFLRLPGEEIEGICRSEGSGALITLLAEVLTSLPYPALTR